MMTLWINYKQSKTMIKPLGIKNYGSIPHLSNSKLGTGDHFIHVGQEAIMTTRKRDKHDRILVFEKYDGSNVGITKINDTIIGITRAGYRAETSKYEQHIIFSKWVVENYLLFYEMLKEGERIVGEWLMQAHGLVYEISTDPIIFFDYFNYENKRINNDDFNLILNNYKLNGARLLHDGNSIAVENLIEKLNQKTENIKSIELPEGMIYRVERKGEVDFLAKWVRSDYIAGKYLDTNTFNNFIK